VKEERLLAENAKNAEKKKQQMGITQIR